MVNGKLLVIEGSDGAGKATQHKLLADYCLKNLVPFATFDFPQYDKTFFGKMCGEFLHGDYGENISPYLISLPYAADRWQAKEHIESELAAGKLVLVNRYAPSNAVYQAAKLPPEKRDAFIDWEFQLEYKEYGIPREDIVIYLHVPIDVSQKLMEGKKKDIYEENIALLQTTEELYAMFCKKYPHWFCIECTNNDSILPKEVIHIKIVEELQKRGVLV